MEVNVEIVLSYNDEETDWKVKKNISRFIYRLKKYRTGNRFSGEYTYKINQDSELYKQIIEFYKSNKEDVEFICLNYGVKITDEEFEKAKAFVLCFPEYYCEECEDIENEYSECESCHSKEKTNSLFYAQPKGYIKKHENDYGFAGLDGTRELLLLPKLVEKLKESGVDKKYFQPIISKSKKILGYTFITDNILPQKSYIDENYKFENQCEKCERINMTENENIFYFIPKRITEEGIKNITTEESKNISENANEGGNATKTTSENSNNNIENNEETKQTTAKVSDNDYFSKSKLERDTMYSQMLESYENVLNGINALETQKQSASEEIKKINNTKNSIMICENLIATKGFDKCIVFVNGESVSAIIGAQELKQEEISQIQNILSRELNAKIENIHISLK